MPRAYICVCVPVPVPALVPLYEEESIRERKKENATKTRILSISRRDTRILLLYCSFRAKLGLFFPLLLFLDVPPPTEYTSWARRSVKKCATPGVGLGDERFLE